MGDQVTGVPPEGGACLGSWGRTDPRGCRGPWGPWGNLAVQG